MTPLALDVRALRVEVTSARVPIIDDVDLQLQPGEILGIVGESGSGKSTLALALLGYARRGTTITGGRVSFGGVDLTDVGEQGWRSQRGRTVAFVPQDPATALNPAHRIGRQILEAAPSEHSHGQGADGELDAALDAVGLPTGRDFARRYPHQLSGGQQQRVAIAMAVIGRPAVLVLDEPTTGLDVTTQARILTLVRDRCVELGAAAVYVSHDLAAIASIADHAAVMYAGHVIESGNTAEVLERPRHPYSTRFVKATPDMTERRVLVGIPGRVPSPPERPSGCSFAPRCESASDHCATERPILAGGLEDHPVACWHPDPSPTPPSAHPPAALSPDGDHSVALSVRDLSASHSGRTVLTSVSIDVPHNSCLAIVGESGSGKTTLARCIIGLHPEATGDVVLEGNVLDPRAERRTSTQRRSLQHIFQNPFASLNPRRTIQQIVSQPLTIFEGGPSRSHRPRVLEGLDKVGLPSAYLSRLPAQLSGGERQRVAIARALVAGPKVLICDEITSALDVSVQASLVNLLAELQLTDHLTLVFITHNLPLVATIADHVIVLRDGEVAEHGPTRAVLHTPDHEYTKRLIADTPVLTRARS